MAQRETLERMAALLPSAPVSYERDALVVCERQLDAVGISVALGLQVKVSSYPDRQAVWQLLSEKYPFMDFEVRSRITSSDLNTAWRDCLQALRPSTDTGVYRTPQNVTDFGVVVAPALEPYLICASSN